MKEHPINEILKISLENIESIVDANKIIGEPVKISDNVIAIPISKVVCGYGVGGSQFKAKNSTDTEVANEIFPFGGGSGGALSLIPYSFIIISNNEIKLLNLDKGNDIINKVIDLLKDAIKK